MDNYHKLCKEYLEKIKPLLNGRSDLEYDTLVKLCGTGDAVTMADVKYRCEALFKKLQVHNDPDIDTIVQYELSHEAEAEEQQRKADAEAKAEQQRQADAEKQLQAGEAARLEAELRKAEAEEAARLEAEEAAEQLRKAEEQRKAEAEEQRQAEAEKQRQAEEQRQAEAAAEQQRQAEAEQQNLLNSIKNESINNIQNDNIKTTLIESLFDAFSKLRKSNMSDEEYAIVKTISDYIAKSTDWDKESSVSLVEIVENIGIKKTNDSKYYTSILSDISKIKNSVVKQNKKFIELVEAFNTNVKDINFLRKNKNKNRNAYSDTYGGMSFGGDDDYSGDDEYSGGRMALGGVMGGAILFSENAVAVLMVTCILLLMYLIHILYYQPCSGSLQNTEAIQYMAY